MTNLNLLEQIKWRPTIGDPTLMGWITVAAYFLCAAVTLKLYFSSQNIFPREVAVKQKQFWLCLGLIMLFLGINKQLDLQSLLTATGRYFAHKDGWYAQRRNVQVIVIIGILISLTTAMVCFMLHFKPLLKTNWLAITGLAFLLIFIAVRATSFHHMDALINTRLLNMRMNWILELSGITGVAIPAISFLIPKRK